MTIKKLLIGCLMIASSAGAESIPLQPVAFEKGEFQYFLDDYLIENRFDKLFNASPRHIVHKGKPDQQNPLIVADKPWEIHGILANPSIIYDKEQSLFRAYYHIYKNPDGSTPSRLGYAESKDGVHWAKPEFGKFPWKGDNTNIIFEASHFQIVDIPDDKKGGARYLGLYINDADNGEYLARSQDGINWERASKILPAYSDCQHSIVYDRKRDEFLIYFRNKYQFEQKKEHPKAGTTRVISRLANKELFTLWKEMPKAVILPQGNDALLFYGMTVAIRDNVYFGFLEQYDLYPDETLDVELRTSRDGLDWKRQDTDEYRMVRGRYKRQKDGDHLISRGKYGEWNGGMVKPAGFIEYGNEWLVYFAGYEGYHGEVLEKKGSIGLLRFRKEGFVSVRSHESLPSYVITRPLIWPGGQLKVNFDGIDVFPKPGSLRVRVVDAARNPIEGFSFADCESFEGDDVRAAIRWKSADIASLKGREIRLEFEFQHGDLFGFIAD
jgi:hypothetical protein